MCPFHSQAWQLVVLRLSDRIDWLEGEGFPGIKGSPSGQRFHSSTDWKKDEELPGNLWVNLKAL